MSVWLAEQVAGGRGAWKEKGCPHRGQDLAGQAREDRRHFAGCRGLGGEASWNKLEKSLGLRLMKRAHRWPFHPG